MDPSDYYAGNRPSPRREVQLQGPRPTPLKVRKDSHKIKKPPAGPGAGPSQPHLPPPQPRPPVIIYTVSPKVIHTEPSNFMTLVQRLTGASPTTLSAAAAAGGRTSSALNQPSCFSPSAAGALSPAARYAAIERAHPSSDVSRATAAASGRDDDLVVQLGIGGGAALERPVGFPGILSPLPSALPPISPNFFSPPPVDPASLAFLNEMSPVFRGNNSGTGFMDAPFLPSPGNFLSTPTMPSPGAFWEFFSQL